MRHRTGEEAKRWGTVGGWGSQRRKRGELEPGKKQIPPDGAGLMENEAWVTRPGLVRWEEKQIPHRHPLWVSHSLS